MAVGVIAVICVLWLLFGSHWCSCGFGGPNPHFKIPMIPLVLLAICVLWAVLA
jgi:hypothetical protein